MKPDEYFLWESPLMEIVSAEERVSKTTEKPYMVVKATMVFFGILYRRGGKKQAKKSYTMVCFNEPLFALFEAGNHHIFEGELSFDWGNTWLKITKLYDASKNRLLRHPGTQEASKIHEKAAEALINGVEKLIEQETEINPFENDSLPCNEKCWECDHQECDLFLPY